MPRKKKTKKENMYFTKETENAIVEYNNTSSTREKNKIFEKKIYKPFCKLSENVFNTFKFPYHEVSAEDIQMEAVSFMTSKIDKYKPENGAAFGYFSVMVKRWFIHRNNNIYKKWKSHTEILSQPEEETDGEILMWEDKSDEDLKEICKLTVEYWERNISNVFTKKKDLNIAYAVLELFRLSDRLENFNKKAVYLYIREISGCKTQNITKVLNVMKSRQKDLMKEYYSKGKISLNMHDVPNEFITSIDE